jgi:hypothetical protein
MNTPTQTPGQLHARFPRFLELPLEVSSIVLRYFVEFSWNWSGDGHALAQGQCTFINRAVPTSTFEIGFQNNMCLKTQFFSNHNYILVCQSSEQSDECWHLISDKTIISWAVTNVVNVVQYSTQ